MKETNLTSRTYRPLITALAATAVLSTALAPIQGQPTAAATAPGQSSPSAAEETDDDAAVDVGIPGYGPYTVSADLHGSGLDPASATGEDLLSAAVFSADHEDNVAARDAALGALSPERHAVVSAGLQALHAEVPPPDLADPGTPIVVLGNGLNDDGSVAPNLANRLTAAEELATERPQAPVVVSGGADGNGHVEAHAMRDWLIGRGMPAERILLEDQASSTVDNARLSRQVLPEAQGAIVATSADHVHRAVVGFTLAFGPNATVTGVGSPNEPPTPLPGDTGTYRDAVNWYLA